MHRQRIGPGQNYYVALIACSDGQAVFNSFKAAQKPKADQDNTKTGFKATRREYNWSGFFGDAVVVTFGDEFKYRDRDIKFVFWSETNYIPAWHLHNQLLFTYEFVETWGGGNPGCHEPMSDRLKRWSRVEIVEDNDVRKVVHWHYVLCNPDYKVPDNDKGTQLPEVDEYFTFYPDGSGTRYIVYTPKLDTDFREAHEVAELISISGSSSHSKEFFSSPALTLLNLDGDVQNAHPGPKFDFGSKLDHKKITSKNPAENSLKEILPILILLIITFAYKKTAKSKLTTSNYWSATSLYSSLKNFFLIPRWKAH